MESHILRALMARAASGRARAGDRLSEAGMARELGCSVAPVREAFLRLQPLGLFEKEPRRQWRMAGLGKHQIDDLMDLRILVESHGLARMMKGGPGKDVLSSLHDLLARTESVLSAENVDPDRFLGVDIALHRLILEATGNRLIIERHSFIYTTIEFQFLSAGRVGKRAVMGLRQHVALIQAILRGDATGAEHVLRSHLAAATKTLHQITLHPPLLLPGDPGPARPRNHRNGRGH